MIKRLYLSILFLAAFGFSQAQAPIIVSDTEGNISEIALPNACDKRIIKNVGRSLSDITLHPNGKMYGVSFSREELYEIDTTNLTAGTNSLNKIIDFPGIRMVGMTAARNGKIYISEGGRPSRLFEVDVNTNTYVNKGTLANGSAGDLTWYLGELYNASDDNKLVKVNIENPENSVVIGDFDNNEVIFSLATNAFSCDSSVTYGITEDRAYFTINMNNANLTFLCNGSGPRIFGSTTTDEFIASETCLVTVDLDENNSSGASGNDFIADFNCLVGTSNIADGDVVVNSDNILDSIVITIVDGIIDGNDEFLLVGNSTNLSANNNAQKIVATNNGGATFANFENFLSTLTYRNIAIPASLGTRTIEVIAYGDGESSPVATATVSIATTVSAGLDGSVSLCSDDAPVNLTTTLNGNPDIDGNWIPALSGGNEFFDPEFDAPGFYTYVVSDGCYSDSAALEIIVNEAGNAGTDGAIVLCETDDPVDLFTVLNGSPESGGDWAPTLNSGTGIFDPQIDVEGEYTYSLMACNNPSAKVNVSINNSPNAGSNGTLSICKTSAAVDLFDFLEGAPDMGGFWMPILTSGTGIFDPNVDTAGNYTYTIIGCDTSRANVAVTLDSAVYAGMDGSLNICTTDDPVDLVNSLTDGPEEGGIWIPALSSGENIFDPSVDTSGIYTYFIEGPASCGNSSAQVVVNVSICAITLDLDEDNSSGASSSDFNNTFECNDNAVNIADIDAIIKTDAFIDSIIVKITSGILDGEDEFLEITMQENIISNNFSQVIKVTGDISASVENFESFLRAIQYVNAANPFSPGDRVIDVSVYNQNGNDNAQAIISLVRVEANAGLDNVINVSETDISFDLFEILGGNPDQGGQWSPPLNSNTNIFDPAIDEGGEYLYIATNECGSDSAIVLVQIETSNSCQLSSLYVPNAFSPNGDGKNDKLFVNILGGYDRLDFRIYNRWGALVFESKDLSFGWDGVYEGEQQSTDVFGYFIEIECDGEIVQQKGNITLIR